MSLFVFLNELSQPSGPIPSVQAKECIDRLVGLLRAIKKVRSDLVLHSAVSLKTMAIGEAYSVSIWCNDGDRREEWRFLRALENRAPFDIGLDMLGGQDLGVDYHCYGRRAEGLGLAHLIGGFAISFSHDQQWHVERVPLIRSQLEENDDNNVELKTEQVHTPHAALLDHVTVHRTWLMEACRQAVRDGLDLWQRRAELFPRLDFLPRVEAQFRAILPGHPWFAATIERLKELDAAVHSWDPTSASSPNWPCLVTPEHEMRKLLCKFADLDEVVRCFDLHARFTPGEGRIHFRLDAARRRAIIAHVGMKLGI
jgi:hypothetical protein